MALFDIPVESRIIGFHTQTIVLLFGLSAHIYHGSGEVITGLEKNINVMKSMQSLFISCPQVLKVMELTRNIEYYESNNIRAYLKTNSGTFFKELDLQNKEDRFLKMLIDNVLLAMANEI